LKVTPVFGVECHTSGKRDIFIIIIIIIIIIFICLDKTIHDATTIK